MSGIPYKLDGLGKMGADGTARQEERRKIVSMYASEAITKGQAVAFNFHDTEPEHGYGNHVFVADTDDTGATGANMNAIGVAIEAAASGDIVQVQVGGVCETVLLVNASAAPGQILGQAATDGKLQVVAADTTLAVAIHIKDGSGDSTADGIVYLLNPANL